MAHKLIAGLAVAAALACAAYGDEITFKKDYGGETVQCQIYKEADDYIHYIDIKKDQDAGCSREIVEKVVKGEKPLVDVQAFFLRKAAEAKDKTAADAAKAKAEEFRKDEEARAAAKKAGEEKKGKLTMRPITEGVKVVAPSTPGGNAELIVDPFPEEDKTPPPPPKSNKGTESSKK